MFEYNEWYHSLDWNNLSDDDALTASIPYEEYDGRTDARDTIAEVDWITPDWALNGFSFYPA